ncbi:MAG: DUF2298 domain-containing protein, partial [Halolamina sp.]
MEYGLVALWLVAYAVLSAIALPIAGRAFPRFSGGAAGLAPTVALGVLTLAGYVAGHASMTLALPAGLGALLVLGVAAALDWTAVRQRLRDGSDGPSDDGGNGDDVGPLLVSEPPLSVTVDRRALAETGAVFVVGFLFVVAIRVLDPAVAPLGGEKFLDFGLLQTLARADALPPEDMWFAGEPVQYYYGGHLTATLLSQLTATPPRFAYNLALAGFYATLVTAAYGLAGAIGRHRGVPRHVAGGFAVVFVGLASNLLTAGRLVLGWLPSGLQRSIAERVAARSDRFTAADLLEGVEEFSYWTASRVIEGTINEFPLFAWLNGDLHAHMMGTPFLLLSAALAYSYYLTPERQRWRRRGIVFVAVPLLSSLLAIVDTWSFPSAFGLLVLAVALAPADPLSLFPTSVARQVRTLVGVTPAELRGRSPTALRAEALRPGAALVVGILAGTIGLVLAAPFLLGAAGGGREVSLLPATARSSLS